MHELPQESLYPSVVELTATVAMLKANQKSLHDAFAAQQHQQVPNQGLFFQRWQTVETQQRQNIRWCSCNQLGHYA